MACDSVSRINQWLLADGNESGAWPINIKDQQDHCGNQNAHGIYWQSPAAAFGAVAMGSIPITRSNDFKDLQGIFRDPLKFSDKIFRQGCCFCPSFVHSPEGFSDRLLRRLRAPVAT